MEAFAEHAAPISLGELLLAERERQGLSRAEVAQRLHWSPSQVEAMETGDYARLPKGTFLRGFVRNYARLLGVDPDVALDRLEHDAPSNPSPGIVVPSQNIRFDPTADRLTNPYVKAGVLALFAVAIGFAAMYWWLFIRPTAPAMTPAIEAPRPSSQPAPDNLAQAPVTAPDAVAPKDAPTELPAEATPEPQALPSPPAAAATSGRTLRFTFRGESWVEVRERGGRVLLSKLNAPGSVEEVSGRPPFTVIVGNAPEVTLAYDGRDFPLEPHTKVAVARFTLE